jgi:hypothetical protein
MSCPLLKTLRVSFTPPTTPPDNGYRVKWRVVGSSTYTTAVGPFTTSPVEITNIPACENVEGTVEAVCGSSYSSVATFTATKETSYVCSNTISGSSSSASYITYPKKLFDLQGSADQVTLSYDVSGVPNRFNVYNSDNNLVVTSGWKGTAAYSGPWGATLNTLNTGTVVFNKSTAGGDGRWFYVTVEHAGNASTSDAWTATLTCAAGGGGGLAGSATYAVVPSSTSVNEGATLTFTVTTTNVANGTTLYYTTTGSIVGGDFNDGYTYGSFVVNNNTATITKVVTADVTTEGAETFTLSIRTGSLSGPVVATTATITINDTSATPQTVTYYDVTLCGSSSTGVLRYDGPNNLTTGVIVKSTNGSCYSIVGVSGLTTQSSGIYNGEYSTCNDCNAVSTTPTYAIAASPTSINEGATTTFTVTTTNVANGTTLYYVINGSAGLASGDFQDSALTGQVTINSNTGTFTKTLVSDLSTEGTETFSATLKTGSISGTTVATSNTVTVNDTSTTPVTTYKVEVTAETYNDGTQYDCLGTNYDVQKTRVTAKLYNSSGALVNAPANITVTYRTTYTPCYGGVGNDSTATVVIPSGQSSVTSAGFVSYAIVDCGQYGCQQETTTYSCAVSNSAGYNWTVGTVVCNT